MLIGATVCSPNLPQYYRVSTTWPMDRFRYQSWLLRSDPPASTSAVTEYQCFWRSMGRTRLFFSYSSRSKARLWYSIRVPTVRDILSNSAFLMTAVACVSDESMTQISGRSCKARSAKSYSRSYHFDPELCLRLC